MFTKTLILGLLITSNLQASDNWICKEESSQRIGDTINACGTAWGLDENAARSLAFEHAKAEFERVCKASNDCLSHPITAIPKRTTCDVGTHEGFVCYRMVSFVIGNNEAGKSVTFMPFDASTNNQNNPKLHKGMTKKEVMAAFGKPFSSYNSGSEFTFDGKMCLYSYNRCGVSFDHNSKVTSWTWFKPEYTSDLEDIVTEDPMVKINAELEQSIQDSITATKNIKFVPIY